MREPVSDVDVLTDSARPRTLSTRHEGTLKREGLDLALEFRTIYGDPVRLELAAIRDTRDGVRGELTVSDPEGRRLSWGSIALSSITQRESLRKKLADLAPDYSWTDYLEEAAYRFTRAAREGEPLAPLTGMPSPTRELVPGLLYEGEPTQVFGDGDTGKSLFAMAIGVAAHVGVALPCRLAPARSVPVAYLDWEATRETASTRVAMLAAGLGIQPPPILYKPMRRPLVDEASALAVEFARRHIGLVIVDSLMFAVASCEGAMFHEPLTAVYNALRLFAPAAALVLNHVTGADARANVPGRPFGGAFAHNGPRISIAAKRDQDVNDATAIVFTYQKANNLARRPDPFGLRFTPAGDAIRISAFDLAEANPQTMAGASLPKRVTVALTSGALTVAELSEHLNVAEETVGRILRRLHGKGMVVKLEGKPAPWGLVR